MRRSKEIREMLMLGIPPVVVAGAWIGLWFLMPDSSGIVKTPRKKTITKMGFPRFTTGITPDYKMPDLISYPSDASFKIGLKKVEQVEIEMPELGTKTMDYLDERNFAVTESSLSMPDISASISTGYDYVPKWDEVKSAPIARVTDNQVKTVVTDGLKAAGFTFPSIAEQEIGPYKGVWTVVVSLEIDDAGYPEKVFIERSSGNNDIDAMVCKKINQGRVKDPKFRGAGKVTAVYDGGR